MSEPNQTQSSSPDRAAPGPRRAYLLLILALLLSSATLAGHFYQPMGSWWRADGEELLYTGIRPPLWKTYHFVGTEIEAMGIIPDPVAGGEVFAIASGGMTMKLVDLNAESIPGFEGYVSDVKRLALAVREGGEAPPVLWVHWSNVLVALGLLISILLWAFAFRAVHRITKSD